MSQAKAPMPDFNDIIEIAEEQAEFKAMFCLATGVAPSEFELLSPIERRAFLREVERRNRK